MGWNFAFVAERARLRASSREMPRGKEGRGGIEKRKELAGVDSSPVVLMTSNAVVTTPEQRRAASEAIERAEKRSARIKTDSAVCSVRRSPSPLLVCSSFAHRFRRSFSRSMFRISATAEYSGVEEHCQFHKDN